MPLVSSFVRLPCFLPRRRNRRFRMLLYLILLLILLLIVLPLYIVYKPPHLLVSYFQHKFPSVLFQVSTNKKLIALTIDDAPSEYTRDILRVLEANSASATFFVIGGQVSGREDVLVDILRSSPGNELGNHAMHDEPSLSLSSDVLTEEIAQVDSMIDKAYESADRQPRTRRLFRPGSGVFSQRILKLVEKTGHTLCLGGVYPHDPFVPYWRINAWHVLSMVRKGSVIICHDRRPWTVPMLEFVLPRLKRIGYNVVGVSEFLSRAADEQD